MKNSNINSKNKYSIPIIIILIITCIVVAYFTIKNISGSIKTTAKNSGEIPVTADNENKEATKPTISSTKTFNDFSNEYLVNFVTDTTKVLTDMKGKRLFEKIEEKDRKLYPLPSPYETIAKRQVAIDKYFMPNVFKETYTTKDGITYVEELNNQNFSYTYYFKNVINREEHGDILRVTFSIDPVEGFKGVKRNTKTVDFKIKNDELKLNTKCFEDSFLNFAENTTDSNDIDYSKKEKDLYATLESKLSSVLRPNQRIGSFLSIEKYPLSDDKAYGIIIEEPTQHAICYYLNIKTGEIYGHYQHKVVAK